jgi:hypothetical protein
VFKAQQIIAQRFTEFHPKKEFDHAPFSPQQKQKWSNTFSRKVIQLPVTPRAAADQFFGFMKVLKKGFNLMKNHQSSRNTKKNI